MKKTLSVILAAVMLLSFTPMFASATQAATRTTGLYLDKEEFKTDCENKEEGWSWDADTHTLTLNNARIEAGNQNAINLPEGSTTIVLIGENYLSSYGDDDNGNRVICRDSSSGINIKGDGSLVVEALGSDDAMDVSHLTVESGTVTVLNGMVWTLGGVTVNGGKLIIDVLNAPDDGSGIGDDCIYTNGTVTVSGGEMILKAQRAAIFIDGIFNSSPNGLVITGGDVYLQGNTCAAWIGYDGEKKTTINTTGTVTIDKSPIGIYAGNGTIEVLKGIINNPANLEPDMLFRDPDGTAKIALADYSAVDAAIAKIPADLSDYTDESVAAIQAAVNAVDRELNVLDQAKVNEYAEAIEAAIEAIEEETFFGKVEKFFSNLFGGESDGECWLIRVFKAIIDFFTNIFNSIFGWITR